MSEYKTITIDNMEYDLIPKVKENIPIKLFDTYIEQFTIVVRNGVYFKRKETKRFIEWTRSKEDAGIPKELELILENWYQMNKSLDYGK